MLGFSLYILPFSLSLFTCCRGAGGCGGAYLRSVGWGRGATRLGAFPWQCNQPISVRGPQQRPWRCQLISPEAVRWQEFADRQRLEKVLRRVRLFSPQRQQWQQLRAGVSTGERLYNPRQCSETVRPWSPPFQPGRSQTSLVLCGLTPLRCHSYTFNHFLSFFFFFFAVKSGLDTTKGITTPACVERWRPIRRRRGEPFWFSSPVLMIAVNRWVCVRWGNSRWLLLHRGRPVAAALHVTWPWSDRVRLSKISACGFTTPFVMRL